MCKLSVYTMYLETHEPGPMLWRKVIIACCWTARAFTVHAVIMGNRSSSSRRMTSFDGSWEYYISCSDRQCIVRKLVYWAMHAVGR